MDGKEAEEEEQAVESPSYPGPISSDLLFYFVCCRTLLSLPVVTPPYTESVAAELKESAVPLDHILLIIFLVPLDEDSCAESNPGKGYEPDRNQHSSPVKLGRSGI